jgi:ArsR family transcriptional regulator, arsenate/arsenite/antimonite-responsive transcriptional repressor
MSPDISQKTASYRGRNSHPERSEGSGMNGEEILHFAQDDSSPFPGSLTSAYRPARNGVVTTPLPEGMSAMNMWDFMAISKALGDENRVRMLLALRKQELCLCQIVELVGLAPSTVSKHMSILRQSRLVEGRKAGRWQYYRLAGPNVSPTIRQAIEWVRKSLADDPRAVGDAERLERILQLDPQELCKP